MSGGAEGGGDRTSGGAGPRGSGADGDRSAGGAGGPADGSDARPRIETDDAELFAAELREVTPRLPERIETDEDDIEQGVARLVLTLVEFLRQVLEHQAVRRMEGGSLSDEEVERLGLALLRLQERLQEIKDVFGVEDEELNVDLGPLGRLLR